MAKNFHADVELNVRTLIPADAFHNTFSFIVPDAVGDTAAGVIIQTALTTFYNSDPGTGASISNEVLGAQLSGDDDAMFVRVYDVTGELDGSGPFGSPVYTGTWTLNTDFDPGLPSEVAAVLSFHADLTDLPEEAGVTRPAARRRGRVYIGPLQASVVVQTTPGVVHILDDRVQTIGQAGAGILTYLDTFGEGIEWAVWSRAGAAMYPVTGGFVDNAFDTQRRRGIEASSRFVW